MTQGSPYSSLPQGLADLPLGDLASLRREAEARVTLLIDLLDLLAPDPDLEDDDAPEDGGDREPSLGFIDPKITVESTGYHSDRRYLTTAYFDQTNAQGGTDDREGDEHDGREPDDDTGIGDAGGLAEQTNGEPSLGSFDRLMNQQHAWQQRLSPNDWAPGIDAELDNADREDDDPAGGDVVDQPHDDKDEDGQECNGDPEPMHQPPMMA
jgi:hypothetical protein